MGWNEEIRQVIADYADLRVEFSVNDVLPKVGYPEGDHSAIGKAFAEFSKAGLIECVGLTQSDEPSRKGGGVRVWRGVDPNQGKLI